MQESKNYQRTYDLLANELHIPMKYKGFVQLVDIISFKSENLLVSNQTIYKQVSKKYNVTTSAISNNIGKIVNVANGVITQEEKDKYFKASIYNGGYITTSTFINSLANYIHAKM